uniref:Uncharacterized protein n=1 Tax=Magallana gigas TaxID=29159 RepID=A0A8W8L1E5_MAGGI
MFGFKLSPLLTRDTACQLVTEIGKTCGIGLIPSVVLSASALALLKKRPAVMRFLTETWRQDEEEGNPLHRCGSRESLSPTPSREPRPSPQRSSCVDGGLNTEVLFIVTCLPR